MLRIICTIVNRRPVSTSKNSPPLKFNGKKLVGLCTENMEWNKIYSMARKAYKHSGNFCTTRILPSHTKICHKDLSNNIHYYKWCKASYWWTIPLRHVLQQLQQHRTTGIEWSGELTKHQKLSAGFNIAKFVQSGASIIPMVLFSHMLYFRGRHDENVRSDSEI